MGQTLSKHFTSIQQKFLDEVRHEPYLIEKFYLTGGTALAACYLNHRQSEDIDLFSVKPLDEQRVVAAFSQRIGPIAKTIDYVRSAFTASLHYPCLSPFPAHQCRRTSAKTSNARGVGFNNK